MGASTNFGVGEVVVLFVDRFWDDLRSNHWKLMSVAHCQGVRPLHCSIWSMRCCQSVLFIWGCAQIETFPRNSQQLNRQQLLNKIVFGTTKDMFINTCCSVNGYRQIKICHIYQFSKYVPKWIFQLSFSIPSRILTLNYSRLIITLKAKYLNSPILRKV